MHSVIVIGSFATKLRSPPGDLDLVCTIEAFFDFVSKMRLDGHEILSVFALDEAKYKMVARTKKDGKVLMVEADIAWDGSTAKELVEFVLSNDENQGIYDIQDLFGSRVLMTSMQFNYMLKMSHRFKKNSKFFKKTMEDVHTLRWLGCGIPNNMLDFYQDRMKRTYNYSHPKLNVEKSEFFSGDGIDYKYDHDSIHQTVKWFDHPAYEYFKPAGNQVYTSKRMFDDLTQLMQWSATLEEAYVLAIERCYVPFYEEKGGVGFDRRAAFNMALEKVCTSITSGWFREASWENYGYVCALYNPRYIDDFRAGVENGTVKLFNKGT